jgi:hypothetical protein
VDGTPSSGGLEGSGSGWAVTAGAVFAATTTQLAAATFLVPHWSQFEGKGFGARLVAYPVLMMLVPAGWALWRRATGGTMALPWAGIALIMAPFLIDVTGNSANLYDSVDWWDDANHFVNWLLLCGGIGALLLRTRIQPPWALGLVVVGMGAVLAVGWELAEWYTFIRHGTELDTAYTDTLGDEALGTLGGAVAAVLVTRYARHRQRSK